MTAVEEFGIAAVEAQAAGRPVIARRGGGALETVVDGRHRAVSGRAARGELAEAVLAFDDAAVDPAGVRRQRGPVRRRRASAAGCSAEVDAAFADGLATPPGGERQPLPTTRLVRRAARDAHPVALSRRDACRCAHRRARSCCWPGPTVLAFFTGGYFDRAAGVGRAGRVGAGRGRADRLDPARCRAAARVVAGARRPRAARGLDAALDPWAPIAGDAYHAGQLVMLYVGRAAGRDAAARERPSRGVRSSRRWPPARVIVIGYGISERLLPGVLHFARSVSAQGRLEQPLTYWNAMGELAALGFVLCAARRRRPDAAGLAASGRRRRGGARSGWGCTSASRVARCSRARPGWWR